MHDNGALVEVEMKGSVLNEERACFGPGIPPHWRRFIKHRLIRQGLSYDGLGVVPTNYSAQSPSRLVHPAQILAR